MNTAAPESFLAKLQPDSACLRSPQQHTLKTSFSCAGVGLHTGELTHVQVLPAIAGQGRYFVRVDLPAQPIIPAQIEFVRQTVLSTELVQAKATVRTVEHLLAALSCLGIDNARIEIDGPEVPLLDGSALEWVRAISQAGSLPQALLRPQRLLQQPVCIYQDDAFAIALPAAETRFSYGIDFDVAAIGQQWHSQLLPDFATEIAPARTFGLAHQVENLRQRGLIKGGSLDNALVCGPEGWLNPPLRFTNEPVRHKLLDFLGDLSLLDSLPQAHYLAYKASHSLHTQLAQQLTLIGKDAGLD
ncbi:MAG: UDP-3-O-acyl-N-acetylglucosamine deacetylase [Aphanocapsa sp. GSE-SYN-MK-11-07L]|jgi:UDP-3-O-[3-hydroxymyristoyl] N-acetylglucosamine deacetylase|nr:UDP-3-O-acyl-N-acetylglucosamine deacetylase [Aphanocapsa sp. GSE-SYN-MK-11-07L]